MFLFIAFSQIHLGLDSSYTVSASHNSVDWLMRMKKWSDDVLVKGKQKHRLIKDGLSYNWSIGCDAIHWKNVTLQQTFGVDWTPHTARSGYIHRAHGATDTKHHPTINHAKSKYRHQLEPDARDNNIPMIPFLPHIYSLKRGIGYSYTSTLQWRHESRFEPFIGVLLLLAKFDTLYQDTRIEGGIDYGLQKGQSQFRLGVGTIAGIGYRVNKRLQLRWFASYKLFRSIKQDTPVWNNASVVSVQHRYSPRYWKWGVGIRISF